MYTFYLTNGGKHARYCPRTTDCGRAAQRNQKLKTWLMRINLSFAFLLTCFLQIANAGVAQRISLSEKNQKLSVIFDQIRKQSEYDFVYPKSLLKDAKTVSVNIKEGSLQEVLALCFKDQPFTFLIEEKTVIVRPRPVEYFVPETRLYAASPIVISGKVTGAKGEPVVGATVSVKGTGIKVYTDKAGAYTLTVAEGQKDLVLVFTYVGMKPQEVAYKGGAINVVLREEVQNLDQVVITGMFNKSKESYTGAARTVTSKELQQFQGRNIFVTLGNIDPSFYLLPNNNLGSNPNQIPDIQLRGSRNLPNIDQLQNNTAAALNTPLIILDGFPSTLQRMMDLNNNEIASITLLKDGAATALYGSRGANGVVVITTKAPVGGKLRLTYRGMMNMSMPDLSSYQVLHSRDKLELERLSGYYQNPTKDVASNISMQQYYNEVKGIVESGLNTDWMAKPLQTQVDQNHSLRLEGGDNSFRYALMGQYNKINGVMKGSGREAVNATADLSYRLNRLNFRNTLMIGNTKANESNWGSFSEYVKLNPYWSPYDKNGNVARFFQPYNYAYWVQNGGLSTAFANPMFNSTLNTYNKSGYTSITNNFQIEWTPIDHLILRSGLGITSNNSTADNFKPALHSDFNTAEFQRPENIARKGSYAYSSGKSSNYTVNLTANYNNTFSRVHNINVGVNLDATEDKGYNYSFLAEGFPDASLDFIGGALQYAKNGTPSGMESTTRRTGIVATGTYFYDERYYTELAYRVDGASQFGTNRRFAPFWSTGIGWNLHKESFVRNNLPFVNRLKARASYGVTGNQSFSAYQQLATYNYAVGDRYKNWVGAYQTALGNKDLQWQKTGKYNVGLESQLFNERINVQVDFYREETSNLLSSLELPYSNGFSTYVENIGRLQQTGWELMASVMLIRNLNKGITWSITGNVAHNTDKIVQLSAAMKAANEKLATAPDQSNYPNRIIREGESQNTIYTVPSLGIDPSTGRELYQTKEGEVTYSWRAVDRVAAGLGQPRYRGNLSTLFRYRNFAFSTSFGFRTGGKLYNQTLIDRIENANRFFNVDARVFSDRWKQPGDRVLFRGLNETLPVYPSSRFVQNESTLVCQNANISYDVNKGWLHHLAMQALTITINTGELFYVSSVKQERGLDYPFSRQVSVAVFATF